ncbi:MAG: GDYXXLXY domain-containing protein [Planctomycetota bacterium]|jgi:uncharacterized membrane-anchored protein
MNKKTIWFVMAVIAQLIILVTVPAQKIFTLKTGKTVVLQTRPVDPYSIMSGYYVILGYEISRPEGQWQSWPNSQKVWVLLKQGSDGIWDAEDIYMTKPSSIPKDTVLIKGTKQSWRIVYGIESYFIPEKAREKVESDLRNNPNTAKVEVKIDSFGNAAIIRLIIEDRVYEY